MFSNIHAYLGFIQFIKFSVWPAEKGENKSRCESTTRLNVHEPPASRRTGLGNVSRATTQLEVCPGLAPPSHPKEEACP